ncbi:MAG TPA: protein kinase [Sandaracinaceae bacterium LLY-WYZ-13_1]|nr:protein kinase [Sandaracinaceae bacterium LLY-WYZ-13_1]
MSDPQRKPPSKPEAPTLRPKALKDKDADAADVPDPPPMPTEALSLDDLEEVEGLIDDAEQGLGDVERFEKQQDPPPAALESGRPPDAPPRQLPTIGTFGPYAIVGRLALGGMAEILLAREESEGAGSRYLVVKRILAEYEKDDAFVEMFLDEARVMMRLKHPNVVHVYKFGQQEGTHFIAMEWVHGASLGKLIRRSRKTGGVPVAMACKIVAMVAEALDHAHMAKADDGRPMGIVHRDVTPDNIMISYDGAVKLLDFGIAKAEARAHKTQAGVVKGKFAYMAPEQCRAKELDHRVDVFALGVCLYEALTGRPLYRRETEFETMEAIVRGPIPKLSDRMKNAPPELERIIQRCLAKTPDDRFATAGELQEELDHFIAKRGEVVSARKIKALMDKLFKEEQRRGPMVDTTPFGSSFHMGSDVSGYAFETGDGDALPELPTPDFEPAPPATPPYQGDAMDNPRPGVPLSARAGASLVTPDPVGGAAHPLSKDRRPAPTAPPGWKDVGVPERGGAGGGGSLTWIGLAIVALAVAGGAVFFGMEYLQPEETGPVAHGPTEVLTGSMIMESEPTGATLFVDGEERGTTPVNVDDLSTGSHRVRLELEGYEPHEGTVEIRASRTAMIEQTLEPAATGAEEPTETGRLTLTSRPSATVYLDGEALGTTPLRDVEVPAGLLALELETPDGERHRRGVMVRADDETSTHVDLRP